MTKDSIEKKVRQRIDTSTALLEMRLARYFHDAGLSVQHGISAAAGTDGRRHLGVAVSYLAQGAHYRLHGSWQLACLPDGKNHLMVFKGDRSRSAVSIEGTPNLRCLANEEMLEFIEELRGDRLPDTLAGQTTVGFGIDDVRGKRPRAAPAVAAAIAAAGATLAAYDRADRHCLAVVFAGVVTPARLYDVFLDQEGAADIRACDFSSVLSCRAGQQPMLVDVMTERYVPRYAKMAQATIRRFVTLLDEKRMPQTGQARSHVQSQLRDNLGAWDRFRGL